MTDKILTTCIYCGTGCNLYLKVREGKVVGVLPSNGGAGQGKLCIKGWSAHEFVHHPERLRKPLIREEKDSEFKETNWENALESVAHNLSRIRQKEGSQALGFFSSAKCTNEENYLMQKFARAVIKTNNIDHCARLCHASTVAGLASTFGSGAMTNSIDEIEDTEVIVVIGSNTTEQHPLIARRILRAVREKGARLIVADPRRIDLTGFASVHLQLRPGTNIALLNGMIQVILKENLYNHEFIQQRTEGFESLREMVDHYPPDKVEKVTGVPAEKIREAALLYAEAKRASIIYCMGITQHTSGTHNVIAAANLAMVTGNVGKPSSGVNPLRGQNNVQGACDMGALPNVFSGYQKVSDTQARKKMESAWGVSGLNYQPGLTLTEMIESAYENNLKALYIMGENPLVSEPDINHVRDALQKVEFLVVQDIFLSETAKLADVVLPAVSFAEKDGTFTSTDRTVQRIRKAVEPIGESREDWRIIGEISKIMGYHGLTYNSPEEIMNEIAKVTPSYGGITYERLEKIGIPWPCPTKDHPGTPYLHRDQFARGKGLFFPVEYTSPAEQPDENYPFILTTGRVLFHFHTGTMTRRSPTLTTQISEEYVEINPDDAMKLGVNQGELVTISSRRGQITTKVFITEIIPPGTVFIPFHFAESAANTLTNGRALDPIAKIPELKVSAVQIKKSCVNN